MTKFLIDVSQHQGVINWEAAKLHIDGAILRCGFGDNIASQDDLQWNRNIAECERLGIPRGAYLYSYATCDAQAQSELQHFLRLLKGHTFQLPVYLDCEEGYTAAYAPRACQIICEGLKAAGYTPGVYANTNWWTNYLTGVTAYTRWVAQYANACTYGGSYDIWQYSSAGSIPGISGRVDTNYCYKEFSQLVGGKPESESMHAKQVSGNAVNNMGLYYRSHVQDLGWLDPVHDGQVSGTTGAGKQMEALKIDTRKLPGVSLRVKVHIQDTGWKLYENIRHDTVIGTVGKKKRIEAIEINVSGLPAGKKLMYRAHAADVGWTGWIESGFTTGSVGMKRALEAVQIKIV